MSHHGEDPELLAVLVAVALGGKSPGKAAEALFGGRGPVSERAVLIAACHLLWDLAEVYRRAAEPGQPAERVLAGLAAGTLGPPSPPGPSAVVEERSVMAPLPVLCSVPTSVEEIGVALRVDYADAVRLSAREEILADLAEDAVTAGLHADTSRFHHGSAHAYARALTLVLLIRGEEEGLGLDVHEAKQQAKAATREADLAPMRCLGRRYRMFDPERT